MTDAVTERSSTWQFTFISARRKHRSFIFDALAQGPILDFCRTGQWRVNLMTINLPYWPHNFILHYLILKLYFHPLGNEIVFSSACHCVTRSIEISTETISDTWFCSSYFHIGGLITYCLFIVRPAGRFLFFGPCLFSLKKLFVNNSSYNNNNSNNNN